MSTTEQRRQATRSVGDRIRAALACWWNVPDRRLQGERLGFGMGLALAAMSALALDRGHEARMEHLALGSAALLAIALVLPDLLSPAAWLLETAFRASVRAVMYLLLTLTYYLVFTPLGFLMRRLGPDAMHTKWEPQAPTYWAPHKRRGADHAERQF
jgi:hypothetical protein